MSTRSSISPTLHLSIVDSAIGRRLFWTVAGLCLLAPLLLVTGGYPILALLVLLPILAVLSPLLRTDSQRYGGSQLHWCAGQWTLDQGNGPEPIELLARSCAQPWVVYLSWRELGAGGQNSLWLFADSANRAELRGLRVRLMLQH